MSDTANAAHPRETLAVTPQQFFAVLPEMGKLMVTARNGGATHERIGNVSAVEVAGDWVRLSGSEHESRFHLPAIGALVADRTNIMGDKVFPRVDVLDKNNKPIAAVIGFEGLEPFDRALAPLGAGEPQPAPEPAAPVERGEVAENDPGRVPLEEALRLGNAVAIEIRRPAFVQSWRGVVEGVKPGMGFINVMRPDFHLHLRAAAVASWRDGQVNGTRELAALDAQGAEIGLYVVGLPEAA